MSVASVACSEPKSRDWSELHRRDVLVSCYKPASRQDTLGNLKTQTYTVCKYNQYLDGFNISSAVLSSQAIAVAHLQQDVAIFSKSLNVDLFSVLHVRQQIYIGIVVIFDMWYT